MADPFAETLAAQLRAHLGAISEQQQALAALGSEYGEEACRLNRGIHELETAAKLLQARARR